MPIMENLLNQSVRSGNHQIVCVSRDLRAHELNERVPPQVSPLSVGVALHDGQSKVMIGRNTPIPHRWTETFTTAQNSQPSVKIQVFQGERPLACDNIGLGEFTLDGLSPLEAGKAIIEVTFEIGEGGTLNVTAQEKATHMSRSISFFGWAVLAQQDRQQVLEHAAQHLEDDRHIQTVTNSRCALAA